MRLRKLPLEELPPVMLAFAGILGIGPMMVYRLVEGSYAVAAVDALAVMGFAAIVWSIYVKRAIRAASVCMALAAMSAAVLSINIRGGDQIIWMYPASIALFYLLRPKEAAIASVVAIGLITPVIFDGRETGEIAVFLASLAVTISLSVAFAAMAAAQRRVLQATTLMDPLTGAGNRRALDRMLDASIERASIEPTHAEGHPFVLIMLDIDHFKSVNDLYGHATGDLVLCNVASTVKTSIRPTDSCFRAGGEEFVVLAASTSLQQARKLAERLRVAIYEARYDVPDAAKTLTVTASFGLAEYRSGESRDALYKRADDALYEAKRSGRNRLHLAEGTVGLSGTASYAVLPAEADDESQEESRTRVSLA